MIRQIYRILLGITRKAIKAQQDHGCFVEITKGFLPSELIINGCKTAISKEEIENVWSLLMQEVGLIDDGTGCDRWTTPEHSITDNYQEVLVEKTNKRLENYHAA